VPTTGGASVLAKQFHVPFLGSVPLDPRIAKCCDHGENFVDEYPDAIATKAFLSIIQSNYLLLSLKLTTGLRHELGYKENNVDN
jgi:NUBPL iron-transfer P-loop NTPase